MSFNVENMRNAFKKRQAGKGPSSSPLKNKGLNRAKDKQRIISLPSRPPVIEV